MSKYKAAAQILLAAKAQIEAILTAPEDELHRLKIMQNLQRDADYIVLVTGTGDTHETATTVLGPAKTIGGKPIGKVRRFTESDLHASDDKVFNLKLQIEAALDYFGPDADAAGILANIPDQVVRGVAKYAGFKDVRKDNPKEITVEFIDQIKQALHPAKAEPKELTDEEKQKTDDDLAKSELEAQVTETATNKDESQDKAPDNQSKPDNKKGKPGK